jgi:predicted RNA methylase
MLDLEARRQAEQRRLDGSRTTEQRNRLGQFATPPALAIDITNYAYSLWNGRNDRVRFLDPAVGTGSFYSAFRQVFPAHAIEQAIGVEIDPNVAAAAKALWGGTGLSVIDGDFTRLEPTRPFNLVLTNPPYVRHHHLSREDKQRLKAMVGERNGINLSGLAGLYCHFLLLSDAWLVDGGLAVWLIPSEFMDVNYGIAIKRYLTERVNLLRVHRYCPSDAQFGDALVTSAVVVFEKVAPRRDHVVCMSFGGLLSAPMAREDVPLPILQGMKKWTGFPRNGMAQMGGRGSCRVVEGHVTRHEPRPPNMAKSHTTRQEPRPSEFGSPIPGARPAERPAAKLGDLFTIKRGIATGANAFFILDRQEAVRNGIPRKFLRPILPGSRHIVGNVIEADRSGEPGLAKTLVVIDCDLPEKAVRERFPAFWTYLEEGKAQGIHEGYLASRRTPWYCQEKRPPAPFLCTYMGRPGACGNPFRFFLNRSEATAANVYLMLYPKGSLKEALDRRPDLDSVVLGALQSIKADRLIREGRVYGGGLHKLEPRELACLPAESIVEAIGLQCQSREMKSTI